MLILHTIHIVLKLQCIVYYCLLRGAYSVPSVESKYKVSPRHGAERPRRACARFSKLYVILKLSRIKSRAFWGKIHNFILQIQQIGRKSHLCAKNVLNNTFKSYHTQYSCSSCDAGVGHVIIWPKITEETARFSSTSLLHFLLWPVVPFCEGRTHKAIGDRTKDCKVATLAGVTTPPLVWPIWKNQFWPEVIPPTLGGLHRVQNTVQTTVYSPTLDRVHRVHHRCTLNCVQL